MRCSPVTSLYQCFSSLFLATSFFFIITFFSGFGGVSGVRPGGVSVFFRLKSRVKNHIGGKNSIDIVCHNLFLKTTLCVLFTVYIFYSDFL